MGLHPFLAAEARIGKSENERPDIMEFVRSPKYLNRPNIYPRQATMLKLIFGEIDNFTDYDWWVIEQWATSFERTGDHGVQPDIESRLRIIKQEERPWFREVVAVIGRRGSKGYIGAIAAAYVTWHYLCKGDPQAYYGVDRDKKLTAFVFAGKRDQAKQNQWKDIVQVIIHAPCFQRYVNKPLGESLSVFAPGDFYRADKLREAGIDTAMDMASFEFVPKESTAMAGRGPASFMQHYDEMAHVVNSGANRAAEEVYEAATPALDQFGVDAFIYEGSSPWQMTGQFYTNYQNALLIDEGGAPAYPEMLMLQLTSWDPYIDWEKSKDLGYGPLKRAIQSYDANMQRLERANPDTFKVERRSKFATVLDAYLPTENVERMFMEWQGEPLEIQERGILKRSYKAHGDPSKSNARFGFAIAHTEPDPDNPEVKHVIFDVIHAWDPADYEDHQIDYEEVEEDLWEYLKKFMPYEMTFDQFNSASVISRFTKRVKKSNLPKKPVVYEKTATAEINWRRFEVFKTALGLDWVHAPYHETADLELRFLQEKNTSGKYGSVDHPDSGPVQTKDVADCIIECVWSLIGEQVIDMVDQLSDLSVSASLQGGMATRGGTSGGPVKQSRQEQQVQEAMSQFSKTRRAAPAYGARRGPRGPRA